MSRQSPALRWRLLPSLLLCLALAFAPSLAQARAGFSFGGGHSSFSGMGSRGSRTFERGGAAPITRSMTQNPGAASPFGGYGGGLFQRHPFLTGLFGGFLGSMLFHGMGGFGHVFGGLLQLLIIGLLIWFVVRLIAGRGFARGGMGGAMPRSVGAAALPGTLYRGRDTTVSDGDLTAFQAIHAAVQEAWGRSDLGRMRALMTPEMLSYFSEELTRNTSQGMQNLVSDVRLLKGEVTESWEEGDLQYATAYLQWTAIDYAVPLGGMPGRAGLPVRADTATRTEAEEVWTFVRRGGGNWLLSAIQQV